MDTSLNNTSIANKGILVNEKHKIFYNIIKNCVVGKNRLKLIKNIHGKSAKFF